MGTTLTGTTPQDTYDSLIKVTDNGPLSGTAKFLSDGLGNDSVLALSTTKVGVGKIPDTYRFDLDSADGNIARFSFLGANATFDISAPTTNTIRIGAASGDVLGLVAGGTEAMRILTTGNVGIGTSAPAALLHLEKASQDNVLAVVGQDGFEGALFLSSAGSGKDANITIGNNRSLIFYQTANSTPAARGTKILTIDSQGIKFGSDTAAANALDDYEEGTFTPTIIGSTSAGTASYTFQVGRYTKIGRMVQFEIFIAYSGGTGTGNLKMAGLPFTTSSTGAPAATIGYFNNIALAAAGNVPLGSTESNATNIGFFEIPSGGGTNIAVSYDAAGDIQVAGTYSV